LLWQIHYSFKTWFVVGILSFQKRFNVDVFGLFLAWRLFGLLFEKLGFFKSSGHPLQHLGQE
jgi:hypothetical protein